MNIKCLASNWLGAFGGLSFFAWLVRVRRSAATCSSKCFAIASTSAGTVYLRRHDRRHNPCRPARRRDRTDRRDERRAEQSEAGSAPSCSRCGPRRARKCHDVKAPLEQHLEDVGSPSRSGSAATVRYAITSETSAPGRRNSPAMISRRYPRAAAKRRPRTSRLRYGAHERLGAELGRPHVTGTMRKSFGRNRPTAHNSTPFSSQVSGPSSRRGTTLHRPGTGEHDGVECRNVAAGGVQRTVVVRRQDSDHGRFDGFGTHRLELFDELGRLVARPRDQHPLAAERPGIEPPQVFAQGHHAANDEHCRTTVVGLLRPPSDVFERPRLGFLCRQGAGMNQRRRIVGGPPVRQQRMDNLGAARARIANDRAPRRARLVNRPTRPSCRRLHDRGRTTECLHRRDT